MGKTRELTGIGTINMERCGILENLDCANCAAKMENAIGKLNDVESVSISFMTTKMVLKADEDKMDTVIAESKKIIKKIEPDVVMKPKV